MKANLGKFNDLYVKPVLNYLKYETALYFCSKLTVWKKEDFLCCL